MSMNFSDFVLPPMDGESDLIPIMTDEDDGMDDQTEYDTTMPVLALRNTVLFPGVVLPITVGRDKSIDAVNAAYEENKLIAVVAQKDPNQEEAAFDNLYEVGTLARILKRLKMPDGSTTVIMQGKRRLITKDLLSENPFIKCEVEYLHDIPADTKDKEFKAIVSSMKDLSQQIIAVSPNIPSEANIVLRNIENPVFLTHFIASNMSIDAKKKQEILEIGYVTDRAKKVLEFLDEELQMAELKNDIQSKVRDDIDKQQRDYFLNQQIKTLQQELGTDPYEKEILRLKETAKTKKWPKKVAEVFEKEIGKLERTNPAAAEHAVLMNYLDTLLDLPWGEYSTDALDLARAQKILDKDHYGLDKVKNRIVEYLAVLKLKGDLKSPILCFVGPPGVGKTSLGRSIAKALDREYVRMSLGGLHDESEIRGHRKTYIGAMPGRIIQSMKKAGTSNPVFILDEIDKVGKDFRGDPSSALLEVLDPEQNDAFYDNFLELEYDLSHTMFVATANDLASIQPALRDRMEIIHIDGYSVEEKIEIAKKHLIPKQRKAHGLKATDVKLGKSVIEQTIEDYTKESGVRELDRTLAGVMRSVAKHVALEEDYNVNLQASDLNDFLGRARFDKEMYKEANPAGVAVGLAYTSVGGDILYIESSLSHGKGKLTLTGNLGDVMKESASTALTYIQAHADELGIDQKLFEERNIHIHVPEGAIPKDGPSAGITLLTALTSLFTKKKIKTHTAMTGEITLRGKVLPVGGIKEKVLAAKRSGMKDVIMCRMNQKDVEDINPAFIKGLRFHYVDRMNEVLNIALK